MVSRLKNLAAYFSRYPYQNWYGKFLFLQYLILRILPPTMGFKKISIVSYCRKYFGLSSEEEFRVRYYLARVGFKEIWATNERETREEIEHFYNEHDRDVWRQTFLSKYSYIYKKKILSLYHIVASSASLGDNILDFGCGAGVFAHYLWVKGYKCVEVADIKSKTLDFVTANFTGKFKRIHTVGPIGSLNFEPGFYKVISVIDVLEHVAEPYKIIERLWSALQSGGILIINFPTENDFSLSHISQAQVERPLVFDFLKKTGETIIPEFVYRKK